MEPNYTIDELLSKLIPNGSISIQQPKIDVIYDGNTDCLGSITTTPAKIIQNDKTAAQFNMLSHQVQKKHYQINKKFTKTQPKHSIGPKPAQPTAAFTQNRQQKKKQSNVMNKLMLHLRK